MDAVTVVQIAQLGMTGILLFILGLLWKEFQIQGQYIRDMLTKLANDHEDLAAGLRAFMAGDSDAAIRLRRETVIDTAASNAAGRVLAAAEAAAGRLVANAEADASAVRSQAAAALRDADINRRRNSEN